MKKIFAIALVMCCAFSTASVMAAEPFFLAKVGAEAEYALKDAKGNVTSYVKTVVTEVNKKDDKNYTISFTSEVFDKNKKSIAKPVASTTEVVNGAIVNDPSATMQGAKVEGTFPSFPDELSVGQVMEYSYTIKMGVSKTTVTGKNTVAAKESVSTEAGSFDCYKVESEVNTKVMMQKSDIKTTSWYAKGVGAVKTETYDSKGKLETSMELIAYKK